MKSSKQFCSLPWNGIHIDQNLDVYPCCLAAGPAGILGNLKRNTFNEIVNGPAMTNMREKFLKGEMPRACKKPCGGKSGDIIDLFTAEERANVFANNIVSYQGIRRADLRTSNLCTLGCVYCNSLWSSTIARREGNVIRIPTAESLRANQQSIEQALDLTDVQSLLLAGGEPLIMKENIALLERVLAHNPNCEVFVNSGLSVLRGPVFDILKSMKNVTWMASVDSTDPRRFEYIRHGNSWTEFVNNFETIAAIDGHIVSVHSVYFTLSYMTFEQTVKDLTNMGCDHIVVDPVSYDELDLRNLPNLQDIIRDHLPYLRNNPALLAGSYEHVLHRLQQPFNGSLERLHSKLAYFDQTFNMSSRTLFPELYAHTSK